MRSYYITVSIPPYGHKKYWVGFVEGDTPILFDNVIHAHAFPATNVGAWRKYVASCVPSCTVELMECDSQKIIPENMRKVLNLA